jgi:hypothetical protein
MKPKIFISHSSIDTWVAKQFAAHIHQLGCETFLDENDIQHGDDFEEEIINAAKECSELLILLTPWSVKRPYIWIEIGLFRHDNKRIVAVMHGLDVKDISLDENIPVLLKKLDLVNINDVNTYFEQLNRRK